MSDSTAALPRKCGLCGRDDHASVACSAMATPESKSPPPVGAKCGNIGPMGYPQACERLEGHDGLHAGGPHSWRRNEVGNIDYSGPASKAVVPEPVVAVAPVGVTMCAGCHHELHDAFRCADDSDDHCDCRYGQRPVVPEPVVAVSPHMVLDEGIVSLEWRVSPTREVFLEIGLDGEVSICYAEDGKTQLHEVAFTSPAVAPCSQCGHPRHDSQCGFVFLRDNNLAMVKAGDRCACELPAVALQSVEQAFEAWASKRGKPSWKLDDEAFIAGYIEGQAIAATAVAEARELAAELVKAYWADARHDPAGQGAKNRRIETAIIAFDRWLETHS